MGWLKRVKTGPLADDFTQTITVIGHLDLTKVKRHTETLTIFSCLHVCMYAEVFVSM